MSEIRARPAPAAECAAIGELTAAAYRAGGHLLDGDDYDRRLRDAADRFASAELLVAVDGDDTLFGTVTVTPHGSPYAQLCREANWSSGCSTVPRTRRGAGSARR